MKSLFHKSNQQVFSKLIQASNLTIKEKSKKIDLEALEKINKLANFGLDKCLQH